MDDACIYLLYQQVLLAHPLRSLQSAGNNVPPPPCLSSPCGVMVSTEEGKHVRFSIVTSEDIVRVCAQE